MVGVKPIPQSIHRIQLSSLMQKKKKFYIYSSLSDLAKTKECNVVWGNCGITLHDKLQKLQNRAARVLTFSNFDANARALFKILGWKNLVSQQQIALASMVYKCLQGLAPEYLCSKFTNRESVYSLRDSKESLMFRFRGQIIIETASAIEVLLSGIAYPSERDKQSLLGFSKI